MRPLLRLALFSTLTAVTLAAQSGSAPSPVYRSTADTVPIFVTVTDKSGDVVTNLKREDFQVYDKGKLQPLTLFDNSPQPVRLIIMLDVSGSMAGNLNLLRDACDALFDHLRPDDRVRVGAFGNSIDISPTFTHDVAAMRAALPTEISLRAPTPLWRALDTAAGSFNDADGRRVVLVLSDGKDDPAMKFGQKFIGQTDVVDRAQKEDVMIYGVGLRSRTGAPMMVVPGQNLGSLLAADLPDPGLGRTAMETGGGYFEIRPREDLGAAFARVADELHSQYLLGFTPPARDGKLHDVEVKVRVPNVKPRARKDYQAPK